jgi:hypothetical protein
MSTTSYASDSAIATAMLLVLLALLALASQDARAAEGGSSHYLPGTAGDIAIAQSPAPGFQIANTVWVQSGDSSAAVLQGLVNLNLDTTTVLNLAVGGYTMEVPELGGSYTAGVMIPFGYAKLDTTLVGPSGRRFRASEDAFDMSDMAIIPVQLNWNVGKLHWKLAQVIIAPTGAYDVDEIVNLGRNYWSFDTVGAMTWLDPDTGTEVSAAPGIMLNTKNNDTDYKTGAEFHVDFTINQFFSETFAFGLRGYYYRQVSGDSGSGAVLGDFKGESFGIGPGFLWSPKFAGGKLSILGKWMHDLKAENRFKSDYGTVAVAWTF